MSRIGGDETEAGELRGRQPPLDRDGRQRLRFPCDGGWQRSVRGPRSGMVALYDRDAPKMPRDRAAVPDEHGDNLQARGLAGDRGRGSTARPKPVNR
jgi:hypothetical protein